MRVFSDKVVIRFVAGFLNEDGVGKIIGDVDAGRAGLLRQSDVFDLVDFQMGHQEVVVDNHKSLRLIDPHA